MTKSELRKLYLQKRLSLSDEEYGSYNLQISDLFFSNFVIASKDIIHSYIPIEKNKEPNTWLIINRIKMDYPAAHISIPRVKNNQLENLYFEESDVLKINSWDILEPTQGEITPNNKIDLVLIPLLAFDKAGNRVGYGKGFYDQFLKECSPTCKRVGLSFFEPTERIDDINQYDVKLTHCISPERVYTF
ncbi:MAG: 5-formyltetrahydrofolate cyclo-ligase [Bacteroidia bacterium]|nr:5-formyltetrahydrofolate cyclo-ligase [Bacteroidia bacterium]